MNPSYNSGSNASGVPNTPGVKPGVIASGPDTGGAPVVEVPNETPSGLSLDNTRHLFRRPRVSTPKQTMVVGGGNGMTGGSNSQGPKKGLVIVGLLVIVLLVVGVFVGVIMMGGGNGGNGQASTPGAAFNQVAKYMLFGNAESSNSIEGVTVDDAKFLEVAQSGIIEQQQDFFKKAEEYINNLQDKVSNGNSSLADDVSELKDATIVLDKLSLIVYTDILLDGYLKNGKSSIQEQIKENEEIKVSDNYSSILGVNETLISKSGELYQKFSAGGCVKDGNLNTDCVNSLVDGDASTSEIYSVTSAAKITIRRYIATVSETIISKINAINKEINNV